MDYFEENLFDNIKFIKLPDETEFSAKFNTYIIGFCPDTESWLLQMSNIFIMNTP